MSEKKFPPKPTNLRLYPCDLIINKQKFTKLEISPYYEKHNHEYLAALEKKDIVLSKEELTEKLITDDLLRKILLPQLDGEDDVRAADIIINILIILLFYTKEIKKPINWFDVWLIMNPIF